MASWLTLALLLPMVAYALPSATATNFVVGDDAGWRPGFNYTSWAAARTKELRVGDKLVFKYTAGFHNVIPVSGEEFRACKPNGGNKVLRSGRDVVPLKTPGRKWYMCGVADHCERGQKLAVVVLPAPTSPPAPSPDPYSAP
ncbi:blue copper protein 1b-like [Curcuma longa]|uniref:blue copper protein 1b-like n=1 Tax=Curcuma longa TaxID=136217 RepID=UPI003D9FA723